MKWLLFAFPVVFLAASISTSATAADNRDQKATVSISPGQLSATPEMWFYEQSLQRYQDPMTGVRDKAEFRSAQRLRRIAALRWYGMSNSRPNLGVDTIHGDGGPHWTSGNINAPSQWNGSVGIVAAPSASQNSSR